MTDSRPAAREREIATVRAQGCCEYCRSQERFATQSFSIEHIIPRRLGGQSTNENLAFACQGCNNHKYTRVEAVDPESGLPAPLFHPRRQRWSDHFVWDRDDTFVRGTTPTGRATVEALRLNRVGLVNLRCVLRAAGEHPPADDSHLRSA